MKSVARLGYSLFVESSPLLASRSTLQPKSQWLQVRNIHTSRPNAAIPPLAWLIFKPLSKISAMVVGRGFRKWWTALPNVKKELFFSHLRRNKYRYGVGVGGSSAAVAGFYQYHIQETPITKRPRFMLFSNEHLVEIERIEREQLFKAYEKNILNAYSPHANRALRVANRIFDANKNLDEVKKINWKLTVIDADIVNAIAFPAILQHAAEEISHSRLIDIVSISLALVVWAILPTDLTAFIMQVISDKFLKYSLSLPFSRNLEKEADTVGLVLAAKACFDVRHSSSFWRRMSDLNENEIPEILSTHPANETRAKDLDDMMPMALQLRKECNCHNLPDNFRPVTRIAALKEPVAVVATAPVVAGASSSRG